MINCLIIDNLEVEIRRSSRRRNAELIVDRCGQIIAAIPEQVLDSEVYNLVKQKKVWLYQKLGKKQQSIRHTESKKYVTGQGFFYLGRKYRLKVTTEVPRNSQWLQFRENRFFLYMDKREHGEELFKQWYCNQARLWLEKQVGRLCGRISQKPLSVMVRDLGYRWGSCSKSGNIYFHWRIILLPPEQINYLILHELVHLIEHSHNQEYYRRLSWACPDYREHENWLRLHGSQYIL